MATTLELDPEEKLRRSAPLREETYKIINEIAAAQRRTVSAQMGLFMEESVARWVEEHGLPSEALVTPAVLDAEPVFDASFRRSVPLQAQTYKIIKRIAASQHRKTEPQMGLFLEESTARWIAEHGKPSHARNSA